MERVLVSACLLGMCCRYNAVSVENRAVTERAIQLRWIPVCPEQLGGLPTPRDPSERIGERVMTSQGADVTEAFRKGAEEVLRLARLYGCRYALLKERSPSCGRGTIYDGSFGGRLTEGDGVCAALLEENGIRVYGETQLEELLHEIWGSAD